MFLCRLFYLLKKREKQDDDPFLFAAWVAACTYRHCISSSTRIPFMRGDPYPNRAPNLVGKGGREARRGRRREGGGVRQRISRAKIVITGERKKRIKSASKTFVSTGNPRVWRGATGVDPPRALSAGKVVLKSLEPQL